MTVTVTAEDGSAASYTFTVVVAQSSDVGVSSILVNNVDVTVGRVFTALVGASSVEVVVVTSDVDASYVVSGATGLVAGSNTVTVTVTAADGVSSGSYDVVVTVPVASSDSSLKGITVNGGAVAVNGSVSVAFGTPSVEVVAEANSVVASVVVSGDSGLHTGSNTVTVTVTAQDGSVTSYTFTVVVAASGNKNLVSLNVNNVDVLTSLAFTALYGATSVEVVAVTEDLDASFVVSGDSGLSVGVNYVTVTVTAADSSTRDYVVAVTVPAPSSDSSLKGVTVGGVSVSPSGSVSVANGVSSVEVVAEANSEFASVVVSGDSEIGRAHV